MVKASRRVLTTWGAWRKPAFPTLEEVTYAVYNLLTEEERRSEYERLVHESGRAAAEIVFWPFDRTNAATVDEAKITIPTLTVAGTQDRITPASVVRKVGRKYAKGGTFHEFPDHAHWVLGEPGWEDVAAYCSNWIAQILGEH